MHKIVKQQGLTLIELLIALSLGLFLIAVFLSFFSLSNNQSVNQSKEIQANTKLERVMTTIAEGIRRAGYWKDADQNVGQGTNNNPFIATNTNISVNNQNNCILYSYDLDQDGTLPALGAPNGDDRFGVRLINGQLQVRPQSLTTFSCNDPETSWINLTELNEIKIDDFKIDLVTEKKVIETDGWSTPPELEKRVVKIYLKASNFNDDEVIMDTNLVVLVRNDRFIPGVLNEDENILICHQVNKNNKIMLTIDQSAWPQHLAHGDYLGACQ